MIYGIGEVVGLEKRSKAKGAFLNYPNSDLSRPDEPSEAQALFAGPDWKRVRVVVPFVPSPTLFPTGIDMDEVLASPGADDCWGLRFWEGYSFRLLGELETRVLLGIFLRRFDRQRDGLQGTLPVEHVVDILESKFCGHPSPRHIASADSERYTEGAMFRNEELLHGVLAEHLQDNEEGWFPPLHDPERGGVFHEFPASPPKPTQWADKIDLLTTRIREDVPQAPPTHYDVIEMKRDDVSFRDSKSTDGQVSQVMRYVDFIARHHAGGNYGALDAYFVAHHFTVAGQRNLQGDDLRKRLRVASRRSYVLNPREDPATRIWDRLRFLSYAWDSTNEKLVLHDVTDYVKGAEG
jgi:hypothetical protein